MSSSDFTRLLSRLLDDELSPAEIDSLTEYVVAHPEAALEMRMHLRLSEMMASELTWSRSPEAFVRSTITRLSAEESGEEFTRGMMQTVAADAREESRRRFPLRPVLALAASALVAAGVWWMAERGTRSAEGGTIARVTEKVSGVRCSAFAGPTADGQVTEGKWVDLKVGDKIRPGMKIETEAGGRVQLAWENQATTLKLGAGSKFEIRNSKLAGLETGQLTLHADKQVAGAPFVVETPHARAMVVGTQLSLAAEPTLTHLEVEEGKVRFKNLADDREMEVPAGRWAQALHTGGFIEGPMGSASASDLVAWWTMEHPTVVRDGSGRDRHEARIMGPAGNRLVFNGTNSYVIAGEGPNPGDGSWSIALWFKTAAKSEFDESQTLYSKNLLYEARIKNDRLLYAWQPSEEWTSSGGQNFPVTAGRWYHAAVVYDKTRQTMYMDGVPVFSDAVTGSMGGNTNALLLGARERWRGLGPYRFFNGEMDDVRIYGRALSAAEVAALANGRKDR